MADLAYVRNLSRSACIDHGNSTFSDQRIHIMGTVTDRWRSITANAKVKRLVSSGRPSTDSPRLRNQP
jgi:translation elongation factor EF-4